MKVGFNPPFFFFEYGKSWRNRSGLQVLGLRLLIKSPCNRERAPIVKILNFNHPT